MAFYILYFPLAANVGSVFLASGAHVKCALLCCVNVLEGVFEIRPTAGKHRSVMHSQYVHMYVHTNTHLYSNRNFFGNHRVPSVMIERPVSAIRYTHTAVTTLRPGCVLTDLPQLL